MSRIIALVLAGFVGLFACLAAVEGGLSFTELTKAGYYLMVAFIALVNAVLFAAADFVDD
jgi:hypothetical protein